MKGKQTIGSPEQSLNILEIGSLITSTESIVSSTHLDSSKKCWAVKLSNTCYMLNVIIGIRFGIVKLQSNVPKQLMKISFRNLCLDNIKYDRIYCYSYYLAYSICLRLQNADPL